MLGDCNFYLRKVEKKETASGKGEEFGLRKAKRLHFFLLDQFRGR